MRGVVFCEDLLMPGDKLSTLEAKVKELIKHSAELKRRTALLETRLREADARLARQTAEVRRWEKERDWMRGRLRKILGDLELIESDSDKEGGGAQ
jgi:septal ring factor EnvC (AmiA/AmiB activator)